MKRLLFFVFSFLLAAIALSNTACAASIADCGTTVSCSADDLNSCQMNTYIVPRVFRPASASGPIKRDQAYLLQQVKSRIDGPEVGKQWKSTCYYSRGGVTLVFTSQMYTRPDMSRPNRWQNYLNPPASCYSNNGSDCPLEINF